MTIFNSINKYNNAEYNSSKTKFTDYVSDKYNDVHKQLYSEALNEYLKSENNDNEEYIHSHDFTEIKNTEYWKPSRVFIRNLKYPFETETIDLSKYWNNYEYIKKFKNINPEFLTEYNVPEGFEVVYIDYVKDKVKLRNKNTGLEIYKTLEYINSDTKISDEMLLKDTFSYKLQNKIYGE